MIKNTLRSYSIISKSFHWLMAMLFFGMFLLAYIMINIKSPARLPLYDIHKATGLLLFLLFSLRLIYRLINPEPSLSIPLWQKRLAKSNIIMLYALMFIMPVTGFLTSTIGGHDTTFYHLFTIPAFAHNKPLAHFFEKAHGLFSYCLIAGFILHLLGALYHHVILKDDVLKRMLFAKQ